MTTLTRRGLVQGGIAAGAVALRGGRPTRAAEATPVASGAPPLDPTTIPKYVEPLVIPPAMPQAPRERRPAGLAAEIDYYEIAVRQFQQAILPARLGLQTTVWSYGAIDSPGLVQLPRLHDRGDGGPAGAGDVDQRPRGRQRRLPAPPPAGRSDAPLGQPGRRHDRPGPTPDGSARRPSPMPARCRSWSTCTAGTTPRRATATPRPGTCPAARNLPAGFAPVGSLLRRVRGEVRRASGARRGSRERRSSSTPTTSGRPPSGSTTTPWA